MLYKNLRFYICQCEDRYVSFPSVLWTSGDTDIDLRRPTPVSLVSGRRKQLRTQQVFADFAVMYSYVMCQYG